MNNKDDINEKHEKLQEFEGNTDNKIKIIKKDDVFKKSKSNFKI